MNGLALGLILVAAGCHACWNLLAKKSRKKIAFRFSKVSYVVAAREISIVFSVCFGIFRLGEKHAAQKMIGAVLITFGVVIIGFSK